MDNLDNRESSKNLSLQIHNKYKWHSNTKFHFTGKDNLFGFEGEADLVIKHAPLFLKSILDDGEKILICRNIKFNQHTFSSNLFERYFVGLISKALKELYRFSIFAFPEARDVLLEKAKSIKIQVKHELWKSQRNNHFLKDYLQNNQKGKLFPCCQETVLEITPVKGNVISFPQV